MKVLVLGLPRTGTQSLADALEHLGVSPIYHMREVGRNGHAGLWLEALEAKFPSDAPVGASPPPPWSSRAQFGRMLAAYDGVADYPTAIFPGELMAAYPEAAVILSVRESEDQWRRSMAMTLVHAQAKRARDDPSPMATLARKYHAACWDGDFEKNGDELYRRHNAEVRRLAADRKFLECRPGQGWRPLCEFLGVPIPDVLYPRSDDWAGYKKEVEEELKTRQAMK